MLALTDGNITSHNNTNLTTSSLYAAPSLQEIIPILVVLVIAIFFALAGNGFTVYAYIRYQELRTPFNTLILNLAIADFIVGLIVMPCFAIYNYHGYWPFGEPMCSIWVFCDWFLTFESVVTLCIISIERLWSVTWPISYRNHSQLKTVILTIVVSWCYTALIWMPGYFYDRLNHNNTVELCSWDPAENYAAGVEIGLLGYLIPYVIMITAYCYVGWKMRKRIRKVLPKALGGREAMTCAQTNASSTKKQTAEDTNAASPTTDGEPSRSQDAKQKNIKSKRDDETTKSLKQQARIAARRDNSAVMTLGAVVIAFSVCWIPFYIFFFATLMGYTELPGWFLTLTYWTAYLNSAVNPICYTALHRDYRQKFLRTIRSCNTQ